MRLTQSTPKEALIKIMDDLPEEKRAEVLDFAAFIKGRLTPEEAKSIKPNLKSVPAARLESLVGIVALGGDALEDAERLYEI